MDWEPVKVAQKLRCGDQSAASVTVYKCSVVAMSLARTLSTCGFIYSTVTLNILSRSNLTSYLCKDCCFIFWDIRSKKICGI